jgi:hypothetical protein
VRRSSADSLDNMRAVQSLDPQSDYLQIYQNMALYDFADDMRYGLNMAFYRTFAVPRIAELLARTGEVKREPAKRSYDTALVIYELIAAGFDDARGREMVKLLNRVHHGWNIAQEDFLYVLCTFIVVPTRWIERRGWRPVLATEKAATCAFYLELGKRMAIRDMPTSYEEACAFLDRYEHDNLADSPAGRTLIQATMLLFQNRLPTRLRKYAPVLVSALISEPSVAAALGLPSAPRILTSGISAYYRARNLRLRRRPAPTTTWFRPGILVHDVYPDGYTLDQLGPVGTS